MLSPGFHRGLVDENLEAEGGLSVDGNGVSKFAAGAAIALGAVSLEEIILVDVAVGGGVALDAANSIGARHAGLFVGGGQMSTEERGCGNSEMGLERGRHVPDWDRRRTVRRDLKKRNGIPKWHNSQIYMRLRRRFFPFG